MQKGKVFFGKTEYLYFILNPKPPNVRIIGKQLSREEPPNNLWIIIVRWAALVELLKMVSKIFEGLNLSTTNIVRCCHGAELHYREVAGSFG